MKAKLMMITLKHAAIGEVNGNGRWNCSAQAFILGSNYSRFTDLRFAQRIVDRINTGRYQR